MSNRSMLIICIVILAIIAILLTIILILGIRGNFNGFSIIGFNNRSNTVIFDESYEQDLINVLEVKSDMGDINIEESLDNKIRVVVNGKNPDDVNVNFDNETLKIKIKQPHRIINFGGYLNEATIYMPKEYSNQINVDVSYGDVSIANFENATMNVNESCGDIKIGNAKNANVKNSYGDIKIDKINNKCDIKNNCGSIKIKELEIKENSAIESDLGDIKVEKTNDIYVDAKVDLGDTKINQSNRHSDITLKVKNSCGDIKINY